MAQQDGKTLKSSRKPSPANEQPVTPAGIWRVTRRPIRLGRGSRYPIQSRTAAVGPAPAEGWRPGRAGGGVPYCRRLVRGGVDCCDTWHGAAPVFARQRRPHPVCPTVRLIGMRLLSRVGWTPLSVPV